MRTLLQCTFTAFNHFNRFTSHLCDLRPAPFSIFKSFEVTSLHKRSLARAATASECLPPVLVEDLLQGFQEGLTPTPFGDQHDPWAASLLGCETQAVRVSARP